MRRWATAVTRAESDRAEPGDPDDAALDFAALGRVLGVGAIVAAVALTPLVPHLPTTFLADGLGRSDGARGGGGGIHLTSTLDVAASLESQSENPVLVYEATNRAAQTPLRVDVLNTYVDGQWREARRRVVTPTDGLLPAPPAATLESSTPSRLKVVENRISAPQMAVPDQATRVDAGNTPLGLDFQGVIRVRSKPSEYSADFVTLDPVDGDFAGDGTRLVGQGYLEVDRASVQAVSAAAAKAIPGDRGSPVQKARDIQAYLRGVDFTYSLDLAPVADGVDPITAFLRTKTGYCVQFATAMVMMARYEGIPARMAIGFLPGQEADGTYTVVAANAHAWPELFFPKLGWVRFEPTPGSRTGSAPTYTVIPTDTGRRRPRPTTARPPPPRRTVPSRPSTRSPSTLRPARRRRPRPTGWPRTSRSCSSSAPSSSSGCCFPSVRGCVVGVGCVPRRARPPGRRPSGSRSSPGSATSASPHRSGRRRARPGSTSATRPTSTASPRPPSAGSSPPSSGAGMPPRTPPCPRCAPMCARCGGRRR